MQVGDDGSAPVPPLPSEDHQCFGCGFVYSAVSVSECRVRVRQLPGRVRNALAGVPPDVLSTCPMGGGWSAAEYVCHLRDVYATSTLRVHFARLSENPTVEPMFNDVRAERFRYNERDVAPVVAELDHTVTGFLEEVAAVRDSDWERTFERLRGEIRTIRWLVRNAAHEGVHHVGDIQRVIADARQEIVLPRSP